MNDHCINMKVGIIVVVLLSMLSMVSSQEGEGDCWERLTDCGNTATSNAPVCCTILKQDIKNERECFCNRKHVFTPNSSLLETMNKLLFMCEVTSTYYQLCPDDVDPPRSAITPDTPSSSTGTATNQTNAQDSTSSNNQGKLRIIIPIAIAAAVVVVVTISLGICLYHRKKKQKAGKIQDGESSQSSMLDVVTAESLQYELKTIHAATNKFSDFNKIGHGGFGSVYKGVLVDGREIAVKRLSNTSSQGDTEFKNEVVLLAKLQHRNLVRLLGFCVTYAEKILVYEFVPNKSLDYFLFDTQKQGELNWPIRYNIIKGVARGMLYLHDDSPVRIIHRDLKAANVLLDAEMKPKLADFGTARICALEQTHIDTSRVVGTFGYMSPEYLLHGQYSIKSDVYSFGVLVLEIVSGQKVNSFFNHGEGSDKFLPYAWKCWVEQKNSKLIDPTLIDSCSTKEADKCINLGIMCLQEDANKRPTMETIVQLLNSADFDFKALLSTIQPPANLYNNVLDQSTTTRSNTNSPTSTEARSNSYSSSFMPPSREFQITDLDNTLECLKTTN